MTGSWQNCMKTAFPRPEKLGFISLLANACDQPMIKNRRRDFA
ncbi:hypothetical protein GFS31_32590 [Leptolyngbya sp. BL0902]|nr:hypothetical protein GFS31_32590 [Leptolyngbya sp. BL0902]